MKSFKVGKVAMTPKGKWQEGVEYSRLDVVLHQGSSYVSIIDNNDAEPTATDAWNLLAIGSNGVAEIVEAEYSREINNSNNFFTIDGDTLNYISYTQNPIALDGEKTVTVTFVGTSYQCSIMLCDEAGLSGSGTIETIVSLSSHSGRYTYEFVSKVHDEVKYIKIGVVCPGTTVMLSLKESIDVSSERMWQELKTKANSTDLYVALSSMGFEMDNVGGGSVAYVPSVGEVYYDVDSKHIKYVASEGTKQDLGEPSDKQVYCNAVSKLLYIWRGGAWKNVGGVDAYTKSESDERYAVKNRYDYICGKKQRLITIDRPFDNLILCVNECGGYLWLGEYTGGGGQKSRVARININTEEVKILTTPNNERVNKINARFITQDEEGYYYWGAATTSTAIRKCNVDMEVLQSFPVGNYDGGWYFGGYLWNYSSNILKKMDMNGTTLKTFDIGVTPNDLMWQKIYGTNHGLFAGKYIWNPEIDEIYKSDISVSLSENHLGGVTLGGWLVPSLVTGYNAETHTFATKESINKSTTLGITNSAGRVDERCVVGNYNCRDVAIYFAKTSNYVHTINQPIPVPFQASYYAADGWLIWSENDKIKILNLLGEWL